MRKGQYQREVVERLARIESNLDKLCRELAGMVERRNAPDQLAENASHDSEPDKWIQEGIGNIMAFQAGQKRGDAK